MISRYTLAKKAGELLAAARKGKKLSQARLVMQVQDFDPKLTMSLLSQYETGRVLISYDRLEKLLAHCGASANGLREDYVELADGEPSLGQVRPNCSWEDFIRIWQSSTSTEEVAKRTGLSPDICKQRAYRLREQGAPLRRMPRIQPKNRIDWDSLVKLATDLLPSKPEKEKPQDGQ